MEVESAPKDDAKAPSPCRAEYASDLASNFLPGPEDGPKDLAELAELKPWEACPKACERLGCSAVVSACGADIFIDPPDACAKGIGPHTIIAQSFSNLLPSSEDK